MKQNNLIPIRKAGFLTCLFLWPFLVMGQVWSSDTFGQAYDHLLNLEIDKARASYATPKQPAAIYLVGLCDALELLITEDEVKFEQYEALFEDRLDALENLESSESLFTQAELRLQWAFVYLKFGHEFDAAWNIRQAFVLTRECQKQFPDFIPIRKTAGLLNVMLGSVPEKYQWILSLMSMKGSVDQGLNQLSELHQEDSFIGFEADLYHHMIQGFVLQETNQADLGMNEIVLKKPDKKLVLFLASTIAIKDSQSKKALTLIEKLQGLDSGLPLTYSNYLKGEVCLHGGDYNRAIASYMLFLESYHGLNYIKDANYKIGICYRLMGKSVEARKYFSKAKLEGKESTEADKYAARNLASETLPHVKLSKLRYFTDGGYYVEANAVAQDISDSDLNGAKEHTEFAYRKARLYHKSEDLAKAKILYNETIRLAGSEPWYFAPNACLQLGYILEAENNIDAARDYFEKALGYKRHEYKNSIDSKARSALAQLKGKSSSNSN